MEEDNGEATSGLDTHFHPELKEVIHKTINGKYRMVIERSAVKGIDGFKVEANGDDKAELKKDASELYEDAKELTEIKLGG